VVLPEAETIEISEQAEKRILPHVKPQESKYNHFMFKDAKNTDRLTKLFETIPGHRITVKYGVPQSTPDITLIEDDKVIGKIHLLLCDRRDANKPDKYYVKLYFYHFKDNSTMNIVKENLINFFENFESSKKGGIRMKRLTKKQTHRRVKLKSKAVTQRKKKIIK
jgi:hypothetical protein